MRKLIEPLKREIRQDDIQQFEDEINTYVFVEDKDKVNVNNVAEGLMMLDSNNQVITRISGVLQKQVIEDNEIKFTEI